MHRRWAYVEGLTWCDWWPSPMMHRHGLSQVFGDLGLDGAVHPCSQKQELCHSSVPHEGSFHLATTHCKCTGIACPEESSSGGHLEAVTYLVEGSCAGPRCDPNAQGSYALKGAARNGRLEVVKHLVGWEQMASPDRLETAISLALENATERGHSGIVKYTRRLQE